MAYDEELTPYADSYEPPAELNQLITRVIGAAIEVHRQLGPGFVEAAYENALAIEFEHQGIPFQRQVTFPVAYRGIKIANHRLDFLVHGQLTLEIKACDSLAPVHKAQVLSYLRTTGFRIGLHVNFNVPVLKEGTRRIICS